VQASNATAAHKEVVQSEAPQRALEGPAFTWLVKALASAIVASLVYYGWLSKDLMLNQQWSWTALIFMASAASFVAVIYFWMLCSRTRVTATGIEQSWVSPKKIAYTEITQIKLIHIPGLAWLISPRLVVKSRSPGSTVFHTADSSVLNAFKRLTLGQPPLESGPE
jgi:hypothetical protein